MSFLDVVSRFQLANHCVFSWVELSFSSSLPFSLSLSLSPYCSPFSRKTDDESERGASAASIMEKGRDRQPDRKGNATLTRTNEEHAKEFEGSSKTTMLAVAVVNVVLASREYSMIALSCIAYARTCVYVFRFFCNCAYCYFCCIRIFLFEAILIYLYLFISIHTIFDIYYYSIN